MNNSTLKQTIHDHGSTVRMKTMGWMREAYEWHIVFTDSMSVQSPKFAAGSFSMWFGPFNLPFGLCIHDNEHTGPPQS